jgi:hypothetical protein
MAFNLTRAVGALASAFHAKATTATIRRQLIAVAARITRSARRSTLRLPTAWPWADAWQQLFNAATGPLARALTIFLRQARPETEVETPSRPATLPRSPPSTTTKINYARSSNNGSIPVSPQPPEPPGFRGVQSLLKIIK